MGERRKEGKEREREKSETPSYSEVVKKVICYIENYLKKLYHLLTINILFNLTEVYPVKICST